METADDIFESDWDPVSSRTVQTSYLFTVPKVFVMSKILQTHTDAIQYVSSVSPNFVFYFVQHFQSCTFSVPLHDEFGDEFERLDETNVEYTLAPTDDLFVVWRSKVKGQGRTLVQAYGSKSPPYA